MRVVQNFVATIAVMFWAVLCSSHKEETESSRGTSDYSEFFLKVRVSSSLGHGGHHDMSGSKGGGVPLTERDISTCIQEMLLWRDTNPVTVSELTASKQLIALDSDNKSAAVIRTTGTKEEGNGNGVAKIGIIQFEFEYVIGILGSSTPTTQRGESITSPPSQDLLAEGLQSRLQSHRGGRTGGGTTAVSSISSTSPRVEVLSFADAEGLKASYEKEQKRNQEEDQDLRSDARRQSSSTRLADASLYKTSWSNQEQLDERVRALATKYPNIARVSTIGKSTEGRDILGIQLSGSARSSPTYRAPGEATDDPNLREFVFVGLHHAREWISGEVTISMAEIIAHYYTQGSSRIKALVDNLELWFIPSLNPDGYTYTWGSGLSEERLSKRYWRKNRRSIPGTSSVGVDLNRQYDLLWGVDDDGSSPFPSSETYRGPSAHSEVEVQVLIDFLGKGNFGVGQPLVSSLAGFISYHSFGGDLLRPYGYAVGQTSPEESFLSAFGEKLVAEMTKTSGGLQYNNANGAAVYPVNGDCVDWVHGNFNFLPSYTIEARPRSSASGGFALYESEIPVAVEENLLLMLSYTEYLAYYPTFGEGQKFNNGGDGDGEEEEEELSFSGSSLLTRTALTNSGVGIDWFQHDQSSVGYLLLCSKSTTSSAAGQRQEPSSFSSLSSSNYPVPSSSSSSSASNSGGTTAADEGSSSGSSDERSSTSTTPLQRWVSWEQHQKKVTRALSSISGGGGGAPSLVVGTTFHSLDKPALIPDGVTTANQMNNLKGTCYVHWYLEADLLTTTSSDFASKLRASIEFDDISAATGTSSSSSTGGVMELENPWGTAWAIPFSTDLEGNGTNVRRSYQAYSAGGGDSDGSSGLNTVALAVIVSLIVLTAIIGGLAAVYFCYFKEQWGNKKKQEQPSVTANKKQPPRFRQGRDSSSSDVAVVVEPSSGNTRTSMTFSKRKQDVDTDDKLSSQQLEEGKQPAAAATAAVVDVSHVGVDIEPSEKDHHYANSRGDQQQFSPKD